MDTTQYTLLFIVMLACHSEDVHVMLDMPPPNPTVTCTPPNHREYPF